MKSIRIYIPVILLFTWSIYAQTIHDAAESGNLDLVKKIVKENLQLLNDNTGAEGRYPLHCAIRGKQVEVAKWLIEQGADIEAKTINGSSALSYAAYWGMTDIVLQLIDKGAKLKDDVTNSGFTPLQMAVMQNNIDITKILLDKGTDINSKGGIPALLLAVRREDLSMVELLLDAGADPNTRNPNSNSTPILSAVASGNVNLIKLLLAAGADVSLTNNQGKSAIRIASEYGQVNAVQYLLNNKNIDVNETDTSHGQTPLHAASICGSAGIVKLLLTYNADINAKGNAGNTPLYYAVKYGHKNVADLLIAAGAEAKNLSENYGYTNILRKSINNGEAYIWYLGHCGFAVKTKTKLLIFDYWNYDIDPAEPLLANGHVIPGEMAGLDVCVFVSHAHHDHFDKTILEWEKSLSNIKYIFGWDEYDNKYANFSWTRGTKIIDDVEITYIPSDLEEEGAFFVAVDGLRIYHGGDYFYREVDSGNLQFLSDKYGKADIVFVECGFEHIAENSISILNPSIMFPMHWRHSEMRYKTFADKVKDKYSNTRFICAENRGDNYFYSFGKINSN